MKDENQELLRFHNMLFTGAIQPEGDKSKDELPKRLSSLYRHLYNEGWHVHANTVALLAMELFKREPIIQALNSFENDNPDLFYTIGKGRISEGEPIYGAIVLDDELCELGKGESDVSALDALQSAVASLKLNKLDCEGCSDDSETV